MALFPLSFVSKDRFMGYRYLFYLSPFYSWDGNTNKYVEIASDKQVASQRLDEKE
jgi:hypothetical protein